MSAGRLNLSSDPGVSFTASAVPPTGNSGDSVQGKKFVGIKFTCCGVYARVYVNKDGNAYEGRCPKCLKPVKLKIGEGGTSNRFFEAE